MFLTDPVPDFERFISVIIQRIMVCEKHPSTPGMPCYQLPSDRSNKDHGLDMTNWGICNWRARQAGYVGGTPFLKK